MIENETSHTLSGTCDQRGPIATFGVEDVRPLLSPQNGLFSRLRRAVAHTFGHGDGFWLTLDFSAEALMKTRYRLFRMVGYGRVVAFIFSIKLSLSLSPDSPRLGQRAA